MNELKLPVTENEVIESARILQIYCTNTSCKECPFYKKGSENNSHCRIMQGNPSSLRFREVSKWEVM